MSQPTIYRYIGQVLPPLAPMLLWTFGMEFLVRQGIVDAWIIPAPFDVLGSMWNDRAEIFSATGQTLISALAGLGFSFVIGSFVAVLLAAFPWFRRAFYPYAVFFQTVPIIALAPILVIWFGFGTPTVIASSFIVSVFPIIASTLLGLESTDPALVDLFRLYRAPRFQFLVKLKIPFALPQVFSGLRIAAGLAVIGAIVGEFIGGGGLGALVDAARSQQRIDKVFAAVLISSVLGVILVGSVNLLSAWILGPWHASEKKT
jgi:NitT/TauT family transport system permease protein